MRQTISVCCLLLLLFFVLSTHAQINEDLLNYPPLFVNLTARRQQFALLNDQYQLPCKVRARPGSVYTWYHDNVLITSGWLDAVFYDQTEGTLRIKAVNRVDGYYFCRATSEMPERNSNPSSTFKAVAQSPAVSLRIVRHSAFTKRKVMVHNWRLGEYLRIGCEPPNFLPRARMSWQNPATKTDLTDPRFFVEPSGNLHILSVAHGPETDQLGVECCAMNTMASVTYCRAADRVELHDNSTVNASPVLRYSSDASSATFTEGDQAVWIACAFSANPLASVEWRRLGNASLQASSDGVYLRFETVSVSHAGTYQCRGSNKLATTEWYSVDVTVHTRPVFVSSYFDSIRVLSPNSEGTVNVTATQQSALPDYLQVGLVNATVGDTVSLDCRCQGQPSPKVDWSINGRTLDNVSSSLVQRIAHQHAGDLLLLRGVQLADSGNLLACTCGNQAGDVSRHFGLLVFERTAIVQFPKPSISGYRQSSVPDSLILDLDPQAQQNMQQLYDSSTLRCGVKTDTFTALSVGWWNVRSSQPLPQSAEKPDFFTPYTDLTTLPSELSNDSDWLVSAVPQRLNSGVAEATFDVRKLLSVAWSRRDRQTLFSVELQCRADNKLTSVSKSIIVQLNTTAYVNARLAALSPQANMTVAIAAVLDVASTADAGFEDWWIILVAAACAAILLAIVLIAVFCARRNRGASYPLEKHELATGRDPLGELRASGFAPLIRQNDVVKGRLFESLEQALVGDADDPNVSAKAALLDDDDAFVNEYGRVDTGKFSPDGAALTYISVNRNATLHKNSAQPADLGDPLANGTMNRSSNDSMTRSFSGNGNGLLANGHRASVERTSQNGEPRFSLITFSNGNNNNQRSSISTETAMQSSQIV